MVLVLSVPAEAQQLGKVSRIVYVSTAGDPKNPRSEREAFQEGLRDFGYVEGKNAVVEWRYMSLYQIHQLRRKDMKNQFCNMLVTLLLALNLSGCTALTGESLGEALTTPASRRLSNPDLLSTKPAL
jgi:hypothetical protein